MQYEEKRQYWEHQGRQVLFSRAKFSKIRYCQHHAQRGETSIPLE